MREYDDEYRIFSSWGHLWVKLDGDVHSKYLDTQIPDQDPLKREIIKVDLDEWRGHWNRSFPEEVCIDDVGYWYFDTHEGETKYQPADTEWRKNNAPWDWLDAGARLP